MKKYMHASGLKKTPGHKTKETDIHLWKQYSNEYQNKANGSGLSDVPCTIDAIAMRRRN